MRQFHIGDVLSISTDRFVSTRGMDGVYDILKYMTGDNLFTHQLPAAVEKCRPALLAQFPVLESPELQFAVAELGLMLKTPSGEKDPKHLVIGWISSVTCGKYGVSLPEWFDVDALS